MPDVRVRVNIQGQPIADLAAQIIAAINRHLRIELRRLGGDAVRYWRGSTPIITGTLRASEVAIFIFDAGRYEIGFRIRGAGAAYYREVAKLDRYAHLREAAIVNKWTKANESKYVNRAIEAGLRETMR